MNTRQIYATLILTICSSIAFAGANQHDKFISSYDEKRLLKKEPKEHDFYTNVMCYNGGVKVIDINVTEIHYFNTWRFFVGYDMDTERYIKASHHAGVCHFVEMPLVLL